MKEWTVRIRRFKSSYQEYPGQLSEICYFTIPYALLLRTGRVLLWGKMEMLSQEKRGILAVEISYSPKSGIKS